MSSLPSPGAARRELLARFRGGMVPVTPMRRPASAEAPLSLAQERFWFVDQVAPGKAVGNVAGAIRIRNRLDRGRLERALNAVVARHETLRSRFPAHDGRPRLIVEPLLFVELPLTDAQSFDEAVRIATADAALPFDLAAGPLLRPRLVRVAPDDHLFALTIHHIACDGWSFGVLMRELAHFYGGGTLDELPIQYSDFAYAQRQMLANDGAGAAWTYWKERFATPVPELDLPTDHRRPTSPTFRGDRVLRALDAATMRAAAALALEEGTTLFTVLAAAWLVLLHRLTGRTDLCTGTPVANRTLPHTESLIGFFVNLLPLRVELDASLTARQAIARVRDAAHGALAHQDLPFERLVQELQPDRRADTASLFRTLFVLQGAEAPMAAPGGLEIAPVDIHNGTAMFDLRLSVQPRAAGGADALLELACDLFDTAGAERMLRQYDLLLQGMCATPGRAIHALPMMSDAERAALLTGPRRTFACETTLFAAFDDAASRFADRIALTWPGGTMTYGELRSRALRLARELSGRGITVEDRVGLRMRHSPDLIIGMLAVLATGAAYVPLDPSYPEERLRWQIEDAEVGLVLTGADAAGPDAGIELSRPGPRNAAYVIYTSGSTGRPKGVVVTHENVLRLFASAREGCAFTEEDVWPLFHSFAFDVSVWEIWGALLYGGRLVLVPDEVRRDPDALASLLCRERVTVLNQTPTAARPVMRSMLDRDLVPPSLRLVIFAGEALDPAMLGDWLARRGDERPRLVNMYGITETTVHATWRPLSREDVEQRRGGVIGLPLDDLEVLLLDERGELAAPGVAAELHVGGAGLARGYLGRPELTAERFVPHPWRRGERLYRSGDLGRLTATGELECLGRIDHQVKVRGYRIEPGEIEAVLREQPGVRDCVVRALDTQLVAWVVPRERDDEAGLQVAQWQNVFDGVYAAAGRTDDETLDIAGWTSSDTRTPIPAGEMREWVACTTERILALRPRRVLEIGCGTGMLLLRIAPWCEHYVGTDMSATALAQLRSVVVARGLTNVALRQARADELRDLQPGSFDLVVLNSTIHYFPSADYLREVIAAAQAAAGQRGAVFVGDVPSLRLHRAFHTAVQLQRAAGDVTAGELLRNIEHAAATDEELFVDPDFFAQFGEVEVNVRRGRSWNEMTRFRYDVVLRRGARPEAAVLAVGLDALPLALARREAERIAVLHVPDARVSAEVLAYEALRGGAAVPEVRARIAAERASAVDPESLWALGDTYGYRVRVQPSPEAGFVDALFEREGCEPAAWMPESARDGRTGTNDPLRGPRHERLAADCMAVLRTRLPRHMVPSAVVAVDRLPVNTNGKLDVGALPRPRSAPRLASTGPRGETERRLAAIWSDLLGLDCSATDADFFELGGHSLLAAELMFRVHDAFGTRLPLLALLQDPTLRGMAARIDSSDALPSRRLEAETILPSDVVPPHPRPRVEPPAGDVLLTGATGFLGAFLLHALLRRTEGLVHCVVRGDTPAERVRRNLERQGLWDGRAAARIRIVPGDLQRLELDDELASRVSTVVHNGAAVHFTSPYDALRAANVESTLALLRFACRGMPKSLHLVSTTGVFAPEDLDATLTVAESHVPRHGDALPLGYTQTKWVAEKLVLEAASRGVAACIHRPGRIWGGTRGGRGPQDDLLWHLVRASVSAGVAPDVDAYVNIAPADYVAAAIAHIVASGTGTAKAFHLVNPQSTHVSQLFAWLGVPRRAPLAEWESAIAPHVDAATRALAPLLTQGAGQHVVFDCTETLAAIEGSGIVCPELSADLLQNWMAAFTAKGEEP
ncbi:MAG TPA: amino acid adenylation domain-containing protein [Thermoanaerobaculia bacterium]